LKEGFEVYALINSLVFHFTLLPINRTNSFCCR